MAGILYILILTHVLLFSGIFWLLTFLTKYFYTNKYYKYKLNFYECGFKSLTKTKINYSMNFILLLLFLLLYDGEFFILIPFALNIQITSLIPYSLLIFFLLWLILVLLFDYIYNTLEWQVKADKLL